MSFVVNFFLCLLDLEPSRFLCYFVSMVQSKNELRNLLAQAQIDPRPRLGQNFLIDGNLMQLLVQAAQLCPEDTVLEVGAGTGSLTALLAASSAAVVTVEVDRRLAEIAQQQLSPFPNVELVCQNALQESKLSMDITLRLTANLSRLGGRLLLVANLPYNIASPLLVDCICGGLPFTALYFTVQREVADRILCPRGRHNYGLLSVIFRSAGRVRRIRNVPPLAFWPSPRIDSTMVSWVRATEDTASDPDSRKGTGATVPLAIEDLLTVREVARVLFHYRRKKISSAIALKQDSPLTISDLNRALAVTGIDPHLRAQQLSVEQYIALARAVNAR